MRPAAGPQSDRSRSIRSRALSSTRPDWWPDRPRQRQDTAAIRCSARKCHIQKRSDQQQAGQHAATGVAKSHPLRPSTPAEGHRSRNRMPPIRTGAGQPRAIRKTTRRIACPGIRRLKSREAVARAAVTPARRRTAIAAISDDCPSLARGDTATCGQVPRMNRQYSVRIGSPSVC